jgi:peptidoglycan/xylan/chitin deacetylase (PgdA/CDA1 family)
MAETKLNSKVTIIMYHYVRDLKLSRYPEIKGLDIREFKGQLEYLKKHYYFITMEMLIDALENKTGLPPHSVLLTFDDGYIDHYQYVFPVLDELKIQGSFYPPAKAITEQEVLDVNKIHFILAAEPNKTKIIKEIYDNLDKYRDDFNLKSNTWYFDKLAKPNRFDTPEVIFIKRLLQTELNETLRKTITNRLFERFVGMDEQSFSSELYMNIEQLRCMRRNGMHIGSHGFDHYWLGTLSKEKQDDEILQSLKFLKQLRCNINKWTMCYPYGNYNESTIELLSKYNCKLAMTTKVAIADLEEHNKFELPRLDTNDIPKRKS